MLDPVVLSARLSGIRERLADAARRARRDPASVRLVAVSKTFPIDAVRACAALGQCDFGENKVQEGLAKSEATADLSLRWHFIGHLQSNKAKKAVAFDTIHSIDSEALLIKIDEAAHAAGRTVDVLLQVDLAGEATKFGATPDQLARLVDTANRCTAAQLVGLMTLPPAVDDPEAARPYFATLREIAERLTPRARHAAMLRELSMGMSHDFGVAIEEGATLVRVGSAIFGEREYHA
ncbi:MAG: YggS family pyridoxal phosphate-dependent enzyme [Acidobacteriaceae bacterium]|nr:YggS family pyridoxal phosphate-dependent enzyme [Acidobacteriaceae bacterium]